MSLSLHIEDADIKRLALNTQLPDGGRVPEWIELIPAGPEITGADGRAWTFGPDELRAVLAHFVLHLGEVLIDWEHASELRSPNGEEAPAAGWIKEVEGRDGALWGRVEWTERAANQILAREYRYLSPVFDYTAKGRRVQRLSSAGLTNRPNFALKALNQALNPEPKSQQRALNAEMREMMRQFGNSEDDLKQYGGLMDGKPEMAGDSGTPPEGRKRGLNAEMREMMCLFGNSEDDLRQYGGLSDGSDR